MERNTVLIDLEEYTKMRDAITKIKEGKKLYIYNQSTYYEEIYIDESKALELADRRIKQLEKTITKLENVNEPNEQLLKSISRMSCSSFRRWRKQYATQHKGLTFSY